LKKKALLMPGMNRNTPSKHPERITMQNAEVLYYPHFFPDQPAKRIFGVLQSELAWRQRNIRIFGREMPQPRLIAFYGDEGVSYTYSRQLWAADPWHPALAELRDMASEVAGAPFNCVLANLYRDGRDSMSWHSDDEPELGDKPVILSMSFGAVRRFRFRHRFDKAIRPVSIELYPGSMLVMKGDTQHYWQHALPKTSGEVGARVNLTFRRVQF
jgi:alkylated DNA repair dioxygenase AlkB